MPLSSKFWKFSTGIREKSSKWDVHSEISLIHQNFLLLGKKNNNRGLSHQQSPGTMELSVHASLCLEERGTKEKATNSLSAGKGHCQLNKNTGISFFFLSQYSRNQGEVYIHTDYSDTSKFSWTELKGSVSSLVQVICWAKSNCRQTALGGYNFEIYAIFSKAFCPAMGESNHFVTVNFYLFTNGL